MNFFTGIFQRVEEQVQKNSGRKIFCRRSIFVRDCSMAGSADDGNCELTYLLITMISNYFQTNTNSKSDEHVEANVRKRPSFYF